jgi:hypothetical protein
LAGARRSSGKRRLISKYLAFSRRDGESSILTQKGFKCLVGVAKTGKLGNRGKNQLPLIEIGVELARIKQVLIGGRTERDILKINAAYFAEESLPGKG